MNQELETEVRQYLSENSGSEITPSDLEEETSIGSLETAKETLERLKEEGEVGKIYAPERNEPVYQPIIV